MGTSHLAAVSAPAAEHPGMDSTHGEVAFVAGTSPARPQRGMLFRRGQADAVVVAVAVAFVMPLLGVDAELAALAAMAALFVVSGVRLTVPLQLRSTSLRPAAALFAIAGILAILVTFRLALVAEVQIAVIAFVAAAAALCAFALLRRRLHSRTRTIVVGPSELVDGLVKSWASREVRDVDVIGICTWAEGERPAAMVDAAVRSVPVAVRKSHAARIVVVGHGALDDPMSRHLVWSLQRTGVECMVLTDVADFVEHLRPGRLGGHIAMTFTPPADRVIESAVSVLAERLLALGLFVLALPLLGWSAVRRWSRGQAAFAREECAGRDGVPFDRHVLLGADGVIARRGLLAHLPQLVDVVSGDMALVGPAPVSVELASGYAPWLWQRLSVPPGITGLAQVNGAFDSQSDEAIHFDLSYINTRDIGLDLHILAAAARAGLGRSSRPAIPM